MGPIMGLASETERRSPLWRVAQLGTYVAVGWLVLFHAALFYQRVAEASILQPGVLLRWIGSAALLAGMIGFRRVVRQPSLRRRAALTFWIAALFLHVAIPADQSLLEIGDEVVALTQPSFAFVSAALAAIALLAVAGAILISVSRVQVLSFAPAGRRITGPTSPRSPPRG
jgi:hypothetical protein